MVTDIFIYSPASDEEAESPISFYEGSLSQTPTGWKESLSDKDDDEEDNENGDIDWDGIILENEFREFLVNRAKSRNTWPQP